MKQLTDKGAVWLLCFISCLLLSDAFLAAAILTAAAGISALVQFFSKTKAAEIIIVSASVICIFLPDALCVFPVILYDSLCEKKPYLAIPSLGTLFRIYRFSFVQFTLICVSMVIAFLLFRRTSALTEATEKLHKIRDSAVENAMVLQQKNRLLCENQDNEIHIATLMERSRIAREIHDEAGHMLTRSLLQVGSMIVTCNDENQKKALCDLKATLDAAMTSVRSSVHDLHRRSIDLRHAVEESVKYAGEKFDIQINYDASDDIPQNIKLCIIGVIKEGVSNAVKHSDGNILKITLREHPAFYCLSINDNGKSAVINHSGMGLGNMKERVRSADGIINFTASSDGFRIFMSIPKPNLNSD